MIPLDNAVQIVCDAARPVPTERVPLENAAGRVLAADVVSDTDLPPFNKAAMDGFACRREDLDSELRVIESIPVNHIPHNSIGPGECARIMTGAVVPSGADCVIPIEQTQTIEHDIVQFTGINPRTNICFQGEDVSESDVVLSKGTLIQPWHISILASAGISHPCVALQPVVGIIATGNELVSPAEKPRIGQIRNSNSSQLHVLVTTRSCIPRLYGIAADTRPAINDMLLTAMQECDVVLLTGGVSTGDYDFVPGVLKNAGVTLLIEKIAIKPGMPTVFGMSDEASCFGLPGNPVAVFVVFELLVTPFLYALMGHAWQPRIIHLPLAEPVVRKRTERESWLPVSISSDGTAVIAEYHGPAHTQSFSRADGLMTIPAGVKTISTGIPVPVRLLHP